jgi:hypothetical protein
MYFFLDFYDHSEDWHQEIPYFIIANTRGHAIDIFCKEKNMEFVEQKLDSESKQYRQYFKSNETNDRYSYVIGEILNVEHYKLYGG